MFPNMNVEIAAMFGGVGAHGAFEDFAVGIPSHVVMAMNRVTDDGCATAVVIVVVVTVLARSTPRGTPGPAQVGAEVGTAVGEEMGERTWSAIQRGGGGSGSRGRG